MKGIKIAVIGGGGAGSVAAWLLSRNNYVTLFEANDYLGGHAYSHPVSTELGTQYIDMGAEYFNERISPNLCAMLSSFGIESYVAPLTMCINFPGKNRFWSNFSHNSELEPELLQEFDRFHLDMINVLISGNQAYKKMSIGQFLQDNGYSNNFKYQGLLPMMAIYSGCNAPLLEYTLMYVAISFNINLLSFFSPGYWRKAKGGINSYLVKIAEQLGDRINLNTPVDRVTPTSKGVRVEFKGESRNFDHVIFAVNADIILSILSTKNIQYQKILGSFEYVPVKSYLHHDTKLISADEENHYYRFRTSENFEPGMLGQHFGSLTRVNNVLSPYHNIKKPLLVSFDPKESIQPELIACSREWKLPKLRSIDFYRRSCIRNLQGKNNLWFCGTDTSLAGHEGAIVSAMVIADHLGEKYPYLDNTLAYVQFRIIKDFMGVHSPGEQIVSWFGDAILKLSKMFSLHKKQSHKFIKEFMY